MQIFYLGTHKPNWLWDERFRDTSLFVSHLTLRKYRTLKPAVCRRWALDSGGFSELSLRGRWTISPKEYVWAVLRYLAEIGNLDWAAIQDWMCEPFITKITGLSIEEHQKRTVRSYLDLKELAPEVTWLPVIQGYTKDDYLRCLDLYLQEGIDLTTFPLVGVGSICRRQATDEVLHILRALWVQGIKIHAFGLKKKGVEKCFDFIESSDSLAWSYHARRRPPLEGCLGGGHKNCANCADYALWWREKMIPQFLS